MHPEGAAEIKYKKKIGKLSIRFESPDQGG
jgi:hypothetical protein